MSAQRREGRGLWVVSAVIALGVVALVLTLFRPPRPPPPLPARAGAGLGLGLGPATGEAANPVFREDADVHDPTPLFLPTKWNGGHLKEILSREDEGPFLPFGPKLVFDDGNLDLAADLPPSHRMPKGPADALADNPPTQPFLGFGRSDARVPALAARGAFVEIVAVGTGRRVFSRALTDLPNGEADTPPSGGTWQYMAEVDAAGLVGSLVQKVQSGTEADGFFLNYLANTLRVGQRLPPGNYRISVGP